MLILRFATALSVAALAHVAGDLPDTAGVLARCALGAVALLICIGLWTPLAAVAGAVIQIIAIGLGYPFHLSLMVFSALSLSLAMLGPGAWSLDALLYGRKRII